MHALRRIVTFRRTVIVIIKLVHKPLAYQSNNLIISNNCFRLDIKFLYQNLDHVHIKYDMTMELLSLNQYYL